MDRKISKKQKKAYLDELFKNNQLYDDVIFFSYSSIEQMGYLVLILPIFLVPSTFGLGIAAILLSRGQIGPKLVGIGAIGAGLLFTSIFFRFNCNKAYIQCFKGMIFSYTKPVPPQACRIVFANQIQSVKAVPKYGESRPRFSGVKAFSSDSSDNSISHYEVKIAIENSQKDISLIQLQSKEKAENLKQYIEDYVTEIKQQENAKKLLDMFSEVSYEV